MKLAILFSLIFLLTACGGRTPQDGDKVSVDYLGTLESGEIFDTNIAEEAKKAGVYNEQRPYEPLEFTIGAHEMIAGFEKAVLEMKLGETKEVSIPPEEAYGESDPTRIAPAIPKQTTIGRTSQLPKTQFKELFDKEPKVGEQIQRDPLPWTFTITAVNDTTVTVQSNLKEGEVIILPQTSWNSTVISVTNDKIVLKQEPKEGDRAILSAQGQAVRGK